jgi:hypothetical protein
MNDVTITREQFDKLVYLAEDSLSLNYYETTRTPPPHEDRDLMLAMWKLAGKEVPGFFARTFGWAHSELEPDGREARTDDGRTD